MPSFCGVSINRQWWPHCSLTPKLRNFHHLSSILLLHLLHPALSAKVRAVILSISFWVSVWLLGLSKDILEYYKQRGSFVCWLTKESIMEKGNSHNHNYSYNNQQAGGPTSSSSSFTTDLFGPKDRSKSSASSAGLFVSVFGPSSLVLFSVYFPLYALLPSSTDKGCKMLTEFWFLVFQLLWQGRESSQSGVTGSRMQNSGGHYSNAKYGNSGLWKPFTSY